MVGAVLLFDRPVMALFLGGDSAALPIARHIQLIASWNFVLFGMTMVLFSVVRANGAVMVPLADPLIVALYPVRIGFAQLGRAAAGRRRLVVELSGRLGRHAGDWRRSISLRQMEEGRTAPHPRSRGAGACRHRSRGALAAQRLMAQ
jgi:hypothetical protein